MPDELRQLREELREDIAELRAAVDKLGDRMEGSYARRDQLDAVGAAWQAALVAAELRIDDQLKAVKAQTDRIDGWLTWAQRVVIGTVMLALLALAGYQGG